jgi:hypothetical protein
MRNKVCFKCGKRKSISEFYKHPGTKDHLLGKCKVCTKKDVKENRMKNPHVREYDRERGKTPKRRALQLMEQQKSRAVHPEKHRAHMIVYRALKAGKILKLPCKICEDFCSQAHHENYNKPLEIIWLCQKHHDERHAQLGWG